jgi:hypothetical protein
MLDRSALGKTARTSLFAERACRSGSICEDSLETREMKDLMEIPPGNEH